MGKDDSRTVDWHFVLCLLLFCLSSSTCIDGGALLEVGGRLNDKNVTDTCSIISVYIH
jgi:hypothetical protein